MKQNKNNVIVIPTRMALRKFLARTYFHSPLGYFEDALEQRLRIIKNDVEVYKKLYKDGLGIKINSQGDAFLSSLD